MCSCILTHCNNFYLSHKCVSHTFVTVATTLISGCLLFWFFFMGRNAPCIGLSWPETFEMCQIWFISIIWSFCNISAMLINNVKKKQILHHNWNFPSSKSSSHNPTFQRKWDTGFNQGKKNTNKGPFMQLKWTVLLFVSHLSSNTTGCDPSLSPAPNQQEEDTSGQEMDVFRAAAFYGNTTSKSISIWTDWPKLKVNIISKNTLARRANTAERSKKEEGGVGSDSRAGLRGWRSYSCLSRLHCLSPHQSLLSCLPLLSGCLSSAKGPVIIAWNCYDCMQKHSKRKQKMEEFECHYLPSMLFHQS